MKQEARVAALLVALALVLSRPAAAQVDTITRPLVESVDPRTVAPRIATDTTLLAPHHGRFLVQIETQELLRTVTARSRPVRYTIDVREGRVFDAVLHQMDVSNGRYQWGGFDPRQRRSSIILVAEAGDSSVYGVIEAGDSVYTVRQIEGRLHTLQRQVRVRSPDELPPPAPARDTTRIPDEVPPPTSPPGTSARPAGPAAAPPPPDPPLTTCTPERRVRILVLYTLGAERASDTMADRISLERRAIIGIAQLNQALASSGTIHRAELAGVQRIEYSHDNDSLIWTLNRLRRSDVTYGLGRVRQLRRDYRADIVSLWVAHPDECGIAFISKGATTGRDSAFNIVPIRCATLVSRYSFAHEVGHNLGLDHDRANRTAGVSPIIRFAYGYRDPTGVFVTLMAYRNVDRCPAGKECDRVLHLSDPDRRYRGMVSGISEVDGGPDGSAMNGRAVDRSMCRAAAWMPD